MTTTLSWKEFNAEISALASKIITSQFHPDMIVAVARGGWIPGRYLSSLLGVKELASIGLRYEDQARTEPRVYAFPEPIVPGMRILLVEDMLESAKSVAKAKALLEQRGAIVKTAAIYVGSKAVLVPDFSLAAKMSIRFPWESDLL
jgi:uncharacterized protein